MIRILSKNRNTRGLCRLGVGVLAALALLSWAPPPAAAQNCTSMNPTDWPLPAKPYFMIAFDTSGSMTSTVTPASDNTCGYGASTGYLQRRVSHGRCAIMNTILAPMNCGECGEDPIICYDRHTVNKLRN